MRRQPFLIGRIARKAAAEMIIDAALAHVIESDDHGVEIGTLRGSEIGAPEQLKDRGLRKFRRLADAAMERIDLAGQALGDAVDHVHRDGIAAFRLREPVQGLAQRLDVLGDLVGLATMGFGDAAEHVLEAGAAVARGWRKIGAAPERLAIGREEHGQGPAAGFAEELEGRLIDGVDIRPLFAIDLDVDEELIHHPRGLGILEAFMGHHMAPMAGGIADRQQDRLACRACLGQRRLAPGAPSDGIVLVLKQVRTGFLSQEVGVHPGLMERGDRMGQRRP